MASLSVILIVMVLAILGDSIRSQIFVDVEKSWGRAVSKALGVNALPLEVFAARGPAA